MGPCLICGWMTCRCVQPATYTYTSGEGTGPHIPQVPIEPFEVGPFSIEEPDVEGRPGQALEFIPTSTRRVLLDSITTPRDIPLYRSRPSIATYKAAVRRKHEQLQAAREELAVAKARIAELERRIETRGGDGRRRD